MRKQDIEVGDKFKCVIPLYASFDIFIVGKEYDVIIIGIDEVNNYYYTIKGDKESRTFEYEDELYEFFDIISIIRKKKLLKLQTLQ